MLPNPAEAGSLAADLGRRLNPIMICACCDMSPCGSSLPGVMASHGGSGVRVTRYFNFAALRCHLGSAKVLMPSATETHATIREAGS